jgi:hypothetical protein
MSKEKLCAFKVSIRISVEKIKTSKPEFRGEDNIKTYFRETGYENGD